MIRLVRATTPSSLVKHGSRALRKLEGQVAAGKAPYVTGLYKVYRVKQTLITMPHGKCAFCESYVSHRFEGDVEHFRPKLGWRQTRTDPLSARGYWWLAYEWSNLFYSCEFCNRRFKENVFPIQGVRAAKLGDSLANEQPLLINPAEEDPTAFLRFHDEVAYAPGGNLKGDKTIEIFGLNERGHPKGLVELRAEVLSNFKEDLRLFDSLRGTWHSLPSSTQGLVQDLQTRLLDQARPQHEYSAMFRDAIQEYDLRAGTPLSAPLP